jgi:uncharacterized protein YjbJ (UPF0337 family)
MSRRLIRRKVRKALYFQQFELGRIRPDKLGSGLARRTNAQTASELCTKMTEPNQALRVDRTHREDAHMDSDRISGKLKEMRGKLQEKWGELTNDDLDVIEGNRDQLEGKLQARYGYEKDKARKEVDNFLDAI